MSEGKIYIAVNGDLVIDQRVHRTAMTLMESGTQVVLLGRKPLQGLAIKERPYRITRFTLLFQKGVLLYACFNIRLLCFLIFRNIRILVSNDLDTLPACFIASRLKRIPLVYDSHEFFTELPELVGRRFVRGVWKLIEKLTLPGVKYSYTVSNSIAEEYKKRYGISMEVVRNFPVLEGRESRRPDLLDCDPKQVIIYQGALNKGRGLELMIHAMQYMKGFHFRVFGTGPLEKTLQNLSHQIGVTDRVEFMGRIPFDELMFQTRQASLGISLEENMGLSYHYALPNKLFDYIQAQIPVLVSDLPEMSSIIKHYEVGEVLSVREPELLAKQIEIMMSDHEQRMVWKKNARKAAGELSWEKEVYKLKDIFRQAGLTFP
jgi:glycosyltransferase involved in cell wall biosynthesis